MHGVQDFRAVFRASSSAGVTPDHAVIDSQVSVALCVRVARLARAQTRRSGGDACFAL